MSDQNLLVVILAATVALCLLLVWIGISVTRKRRARKLREQFGPEYAAARLQYGTKAEQELEHRVERVNRLNLRSISAQARDHFSTAWRDTQARFVEDPPLSVAQADRLVTDVIEALGYPIADFDRRAADISVDHPRIVSDYREAHGIVEKNRERQASTEELREAMVHYKAVFQDLLSGAPDLAEVRR